MSSNLTTAPLLQELVDARKAKRISQAEAAKRLDMPQSYLSNIERNKHDIRLSNFVELARYYGYEVMLIPISLTNTVAGIVKGEPKQKRKGRWTVDYDETDDEESDD